MVKVAFESALTENFSTVFVYTVTDIVCILHRDLLPLPCKNVGRVSFKLFWGKYRCGKKVSPEIFLQLSQQLFGILKQNFTNIISRPIFS